MCIRDRMFRPYDRIIRTSEYKTYSAYTRMVQYPSPPGNKNDGKTPNNGRLGGKVPWCLDYWPEHKTSNFNDNGGDDWGLYTSPCHDVSGTEPDNQKLYYDYDTQQFMVSSKDASAPMCLTAGPRDHSGLFWPTDSTWKSRRRSYNSGLNCTSYSDKSLPTCN